MAARSFSSIEPKSTRDATPGSSERSVLEPDALQRAVEIAALLRKLQFAHAPAHEDRFQDAIERLLRLNKYKFEREASLTNEERIDFLVETGIGIEVKTQGSFAEVTRQLLRYAKSPDIRVLILATTRCQLASVPKLLLEKPVVTAVSFGAMF